MTKSPRKKRQNPRDGRQASAQRIGVLKTLITMCRSLEGLGKSPAARSACRVIARRLQTMLKLEENGMSVGQS